MARTTMKFDIRNRMHENVRAMCGDQYSLFCVDLDRWLLIARKKVFR